jgi:hypothetical protein
MNWQQFKDADLKNGRAIFIGIILPADHNVYRKTTPTIGKQAGAFS